MRVTTLLLTLAAIGIMLIVSATWNVGGEEVKRQRRHEDKKPRKMVVDKGPYRAWAKDAELHNEATLAALPEAANVPPFGSTLATSSAPSSAAPSTAVATSATPSQPKAAVACAPGCEKNGVCNTELGRCDCPPFVGGAACDKPLFPACAAAVGLAELAPAPCVYDQLSGGSPPVSCECLMGCESLGLMGVRECYTMDGANKTVMSWVQQQVSSRRLPPSASLAVAWPWLGRGLAVAWPWLGRAWPWLGRGLAVAWPGLSVADDAPRPRLQIHLRGLAPNHEYYAANVQPAHKESLDLCSGHGLYAPHMPATGAARPNAYKRCFCYAGWRGNACQHEAQSRQRHACINGCSGRGECVRNWCHCAPGFYGTDCSLGVASNGVTDAPALPDPIGSLANRDAKAPRIYIYDLPPRFNGWMHAGDSGWWQDFDLWGEDVVIHRRSLRSYYRVDDPEKADFFLVPVWDSSAMWQMNWGFRDLLPTGVRVHREAYEYLRATWPYFDRKGGADHLWVFGHDQGGWRIRQKLPEIAKGIFISPFGGGPAQRGGHLDGHDIVCPSVLYANVPLGLMNHAGRRKKDVQNLAFFQGKLNLHIPYEYSFGIRQCVPTHAQQAAARAPTRTHARTHAHSSPPRCTHAPNPPARPQGSIQGAP